MTVAIPSLLRGMPRVLPFLQIYARSIGYQWPACPTWYDDRKEIQARAPSLMID
jgi:hypothetical protein